MHLILYGFRICPFVEKINILLNEKGIQCERIDVDIRNKPDWFLKLSPLGKVPLLSADNIVIFESTVINEFLDEISSPPFLLPRDPILKAQNRSWIEWGSALVLDAYYMSLATNKVDFSEKRMILDSKLNLLEHQLKNTPYFNGEKFSMIDLSYAPLFYRFDSLFRLFAIDMLAQYPKLDIWSENILKRQNVQNGFVSNFDEELRQLLEIKGSFLIS